MLAADVPQRVARRLADVLTLVVFESTEEFDSGLRMIAKVLAARPDAQALGDGAAHVGVRGAQPVFDDGQGLLVSDVRAIAVEGLGEDFLHSPVGVATHPLSQKLHHRPGLRGHPPEDKNRQHPRLMNVGSEQLLREAQAITSRVLCDDFIGCPQDIGEPVLRLPRPARQRVDKFRGDGGMPPFYKQTAPAENSVGAVALHSSLFTLYVSSSTASASSPLASSSA